jgi:hypothetical protein
VLFCQSQSAFDPINEPDLSSGSALSSVVISLLVFKVMRFLGSEAKLIESDNVSSNVGLVRLPNPTSRFCLTLHNAKSNRERLVR